MSQTLSRSFLLCFVVMTVWAMLMVELIYPALLDMNRLEGTFDAWARLYGYSSLRKSVAAFPSLTSLIDVREGLSKLLEGEHCCV